MNKTVVTYRDLETREILGQETRPIAVLKKGDEKIIDGVKYTVEQIMPSEDRDSNLIMINALVSKTPKTL